MTNPPSWSDDPRHGKYTRPNSGEPTGTPGAPSANIYGQPFANGYGQPSANGYPGQPSANGYGQPSANGHPGQPSANGYGQPSANGHGYGQQPPQGWLPVQQGYAQQSPTPMAPKKKRWPLWTAIGCIVLALVVVIGFAGCAALLSISDESTDTPSSASSESPASSGGESKSADEKPPARDKVGTRKNPLKIGKDTATITSTDGEGKVTIALGMPNWNAEAELKRANQFNESAPEGQVYVLVPVTMTYTGEGNVTPWIETRIEFVGDAGNAYDEAPVVTPHESMDLGDLYDGGKAEYDIAFLIPKDQVKKGVFKVSPTFSFGDEDAWFSAE